MAKSDVIIASADAGTRERWGVRLRETFSVCEVAERKALGHFAASLKPGVLVLDLTLPGLGRVEGLPLVQRLSPTTKTLVLTDSATNVEGISALKAGAKGYYTRAIEPALLSKAVEAVENGELWVERKLIAALVSGLISRAEASGKESNAKPDCRLECLTLRQREVADAIATGASNKEIASRLNVTERTVKAHLTEMFRSLGVFDRLHLAVLLNRVPSVASGVSEIKATGPEKSGISVRGRPTGGARAHAVRSE